MPFSNSPALLTVGSNPNGATSYATASVTPTGSTAVFMAVTVRRGDPNEPTTPTVTGCSLTWSLLGSLYFDTATTRAKLFLFHGYAVSPTTGAITLDFSGVTQSAGVWGVWEQQNLASPASPLVQGIGTTINSSTNSIAAALPGAATAGNGVYGVCSAYNTNPMPPDAGWTDVADSYNASTNLAVNVAWRGDIGDVTPSWTVSTGSTFNGAMAFEVAPGGVTQPVTAAVESGVAQPIGVSQTLPEPQILVGIGFLP